MRVDFRQKADVLKAELESLYQALQQEAGAETVQEALVRLQKTADAFEAWAEDPGPEWASLSRDQKWGYLTLLSWLGLASHAVKQLRLALALEEERCH